MFHKTKSIEFKNGTVLEVTFANGKVKSYDVSVLFDKYPALRALKDRQLFRSGKLMGYGIVWNDDLDLEAETVYEDGITVGNIELPYNEYISYVVSDARKEAGLTQVQLAELTGLDQSDISKIERGVANPSVKTLQRIAKALDKQLDIRFV